MTTFVVSNIMGIVTGVVLKTLVPMPFIDNQIKNAYSAIYRKLFGS